MDSDRVKAWEARCVEEQPPACLSACPLRVDVRSMMEKMKAGDLAGALGVFARVAPFPAMISRICDHPCETACRRAEAGGAVHVGALERAAVGSAYASIRRTPQRNIRRKKVAIVGAGLAGLTAAFDLAMKGHAVIVLEAEQRPLARLRFTYGPDDLPDAEIAADLAMLKEIGVTIRCGARVIGGAGPLGLVQLLAVNDAVLLATGGASARGFGEVVTLDAAGHVLADTASLATSHARVVSDGLAQGASPIASAAAGRRAGASIDRLLQGASLTADRDAPSGTCLYVNVAASPAQKPVAPADPAQGYTPEEARNEAARCFPCHCLECVKACAFLAHYRTYPKRAVREIFNNDGIVLGNRKSNRMIDSCTLCGLCEALCPNDLGMGEVCLEARQSMVRRNHMPASHHEFALRDMEFSRSDLVAFSRHQPGCSTSGAAFFPGCQLVASSPGQVEHLYRHLAASLPAGVGLMVDCCGAPAHWSGRQDLHAEALAGLRARWEALGRPMMITACATCLRMLGEFQPEMAVRSLWMVLTEIGWPADIHKLPGRRLAIHDPCTGRSARDVQQAVRDLATRLGAEVRELGGAELTTCCGYGGLAEFANPEVANAIIDQRAAESPDDYLAYCAMCRDNFARRGKRSLHLLDLAFPPADGSDPAARPDPGFSGRRDNRARFRRDMLRRYWGELMDDPVPSLPVVISDTLRADLERRLILAQDVVETVAHAEKTGRRLKDPATGHLLATLRIGNVTVWVEYGAEEGGLVVHRAYSHRMTVDAAR